MNEEWINEWMNLKKEYKYTYDTLSAMRLTQNKKNSVNSILYWFYRWARSSIQCCSCKNTALDDGCNDVHK